MHLIECNARFSQWLIEFIQPDGSTHTPRARTQNFWNGEKSRATTPKIYKQKEHIPKTRI